MRKKYFHRGETELCNTFRLVSYHGSQKTFETIIGDVIDTFRTTTAAVNQKFITKNQRQVVATGSNTQNLICQSYLFRLHHFAAQC